MLNMQVFHTDVKVRTTMDGEVFSQQLAGKHFYTQDTRSRHDNKNNLKDAFSEVSSFAKSDFKLSEKCDYKA